MGKILFIIVLTILTLSNSVYSQHSLTGKVLNASTKAPVEFAVIATPDNSLWTSTNTEGSFTISLPNGQHSLVISCLGFEKTTIQVSMQGKPLTNQTYYVKENNLALNEVTVTAEKKTEGLATSYSIDRNALNHAQMQDVSDLISQLPGGQTSHNNNLIDIKQIVLRNTSSTYATMDNLAFGTAIEVDGIRISTNANFSYSGTNAIEGADTRNLAVNNIESVEVVTGLPSVEHGDLSSGLLKIHTKKGKSPFQVEVSTKPNFKMYSFSKGVDLGHKRGLLNISAEHTLSASERASPYTTYVRNSMTMTYRNTLGKANRPLELTYGITGNHGGYDKEADPDMFANTYEKQKDYVLRTNMDLNWQLNLPWITNVNLSGSVSYSNREKTTNTNKSSSSSIAAVHATEEGYFIAQKYEQNPNAPITLIPAGYWYELEYDDDKPIIYTANIKASWIHNIGQISNYAKLGGEFSYSYNKGQGIYYDDRRYAPSEWREYRYDEQPGIKILSLYAEDKITIPVFDRELQIQAGVRSDVTSIKGSEYGTTNGISPRVNAQYTLIKNSKNFIRNFSMHAGWGDAIKLPSANILYPRPIYNDKIAFAPGTMADGTSYLAYYTTPMKLIYNPNLKWQRNRKSEIGADIQLGTTKIALTAFYDKTNNPYHSTNHFIPSSYKLTESKALNGCIIPEQSRNYTIDKITGVVTVSDKTGKLPSQQLTYLQRNVLKQTPYFTNGSQVIRKGFEWIVDFGKIPSLKTSARLDGSFYYTKGLDQVIQENTSVAITMTNGEPFKYVGYYPGTGTSNGSVVKKANTNLTLTTHIPAIRMILSLRIESSLYNYTQLLSEYDGGTRSFAVDNKDSQTPSTTNTNIYKGNHYVVTYPLYYTTIEDINTKIPFKEKLLWAKTNDPSLFTELSKLITRTSSDKEFIAKRISAFFIGNINLTKEIGNKVSISFQAINFLNNMGLMKNSQTGGKENIYKNYNTPPFYYGLTFRLKI